MSLNDTVSADRIHISFFGRRNVGKSSLLNAVTGQNISVVSDVLGTTTDPVKKAMELLPLGPVMIIDTPGFDDEGALGELRVEKTREILAKTDVAVLVVDANSETDGREQEFISLVREKKLPLVIAHNKADLLSDIPKTTENEIWVSAEKNINIRELKELLASLSKSQKNERKIVSDLLLKGDVVVLVTPIDESAPKGRLILPQQQTLRDILDNGSIAIVTQVEELSKTLESLNNPPKMVITDSQAFQKVSKLVPENIPLTSFSILFARYKGNLPEQIKGASQLSKLKDGDKVLISEGCTHHRQCGDIGTVKMPCWIRNYSGAEPEFVFTSGGEFPKELRGYKLIVHCGGCMLNEAEMKHRVLSAKNSGVPVVNYGVAIAHMNGILKRSLELFPDVLSLLD
ncbi:MAG: [FeFe] hydrogenase H-cluster maturation GTPase HydF [Eubacteriales bacterium]|nr:[FeFe] hydrogenase H-cluster maturation GTPase HydF [Eubacteriales bacterium]